MDLPPPGFPCPFPSTPVLPAKVSAFPGLLSYWPHILQLAGSSASHLSPESFLIFCSLGAWLHPFPLSASGEWRDKYILNPPCWIWNLDGVFLCISEKKKIQNNRCKTFLLSVLNYLRAGKMAQRKGDLPPCLTSWVQSQGPTRRRREAAATACCSREAVLVRFAWTSHCKGCGYKRYFKN